MVTTVTNVTNCYQNYKDMYRKPYLQAYKGISTRFECPNCRTKNSFTVYLDGNTGQPIHKTVGICNRINKCGYHYTPKQYYNDNPMETRYRETTTGFTPIIKKKPNSPVGEIPFEFLERSLSRRNNLISFLSKIFTSEQLEKVCNMYVLGSTIDRAVIFWQIDTNGKIRTGKVMQYNSSTGKRIKNTKGAIGWIHSNLKKDGILNDDFNLQQCFFGEHLLKYYNNLPVAIVESEKTAILSSVLLPEYIWLATGSVNGLNIEKCKVLKGRKIVLYPDLKAYTLWKEKAERIQSNIRCEIRVSSYLEEICTPDEREAGLDIADYICKQLRLMCDNKIG